MESKLAHSAIAQFSFFLYNEIEVKKMNDRKNFGEYITGKRKKLSMTQEELAQKLYVTSTTISKWERGVTYPDITIIIKLCKELGISEHEFFTACDDSSMSEKEKKAHKYENMVKGIQYFFLLSYLIALVVCFICNIAIDHTLSWFFIVLVSILLSFSITNLPILLKNRKVKMIPIFCMGSITVFVYILLLVCNIYTKGSWLFPSYVIATFELILVWVGTLFLVFSKKNAYIKTGVTLFLTAICAMLSNPLIGYLLPEEATTNNFLNIVIGSFMIVFAIGLVLVGWSKVTLKKV